jgi:hypothetical protein
MLREYEGPNIEVCVGVKMAEQRGKSTGNVPWLQYFI